MAPSTNIAWSSDTDEVSGSHRAGTPAEAAAAVYLLCIPESDYVSAQTLVCGGGIFL